MYADTNTPKYDQLFATHISGTSDNIELYARKIICGNRSCKLELLNSWKLSMKVKIGQQMENCMGKLILFSEKEHAHYAGTKKKPSQQLTHFGKQSRRKGGGKI